MHDLRWNDHVNEITTKANKTLNFLRHNLLTCLAQSKEQAYKALVRRIVEYSATAWDPYILRTYNSSKLYDSTPSSSLGTRALRQIRQCH